MVPKLLLFLPLWFLLTMNVSGQVRSRSVSSLQASAERLDPYIVESANRHGVDARVLRILCFIESRYRLGAVSPKGARGPMQFMPATARRYGLKNPHDPKEAIDAAARYLRDLLVKFGGRLDLALASYNAGEGTVESFLTGRPLVLSTRKVINARGRITGGVPPYRETQDYVRKAMQLLRSRHTVPSNSSPTTKKHIVGSARDFSVDALWNNLLSQPPTTQNSPATFIEVP